ncbi:MAG TPA: ATPase, T2SS/T4P/T4SS family, partial [Fimbriimonas sp.]|nr:ATPase, T2SS/T4P/T4SS family [Fimbriimonas sp.]
MAEEFNWKQFLEPEAGGGPAAQEGAIIDPRTGEIVVQPHELKPAEPAGQQAHPFISHELANQTIVQEKFSVTAEGPVAGYRPEELKSVSDCHIDDILKLAMERKASDIHLTVGLPPMIRLDGEIIPLPYQPLTAKETRRLVYETLTNEQLERFETKHELDFGYAVKDLARFRFNVYMQRGSVAGALRAIPTKIPPFETLGLPQVIREMCKRTSGLILVTGPTGSGKTTTIASMIDDINDKLAGHILTIEDPIEYIHKHKRCMVNQRELN